MFATAPMFARTTTNHSGWSGSVPLIATVVSEHFTDVLPRSDCRLYRPHNGSVIS